jgi:pSer/pThr/pTyr-binding forkhead associated (FHA) protein
MFKLVIQDDEGKTTVVPLIRDEITIGRKEGNTIRLTERNVSRRHARILRSNGEVQIEDLGSYNGIRVNNARIAERVNLRVSDQVQIGDYKLYLKAEGVEQVDDARTMPIERIDPAGGAPTDIVPAVAAPTAPVPIQAPTLGNGTGANPALATPPAPVPAVQISGNPNRTLVAVANTGSDGRPLATAEHIAAAIPQHTGHGKLVVLSSNFASKEFELSRPQMIIGRTDENDLVINHRSISRNHAKVVREPDTGRYTISDLQSSNGVRVNGQDYGKVELRRGDVIDLGHVRLRFVEPGEDFVFARDAVITDVPDASSKKGLLVAVVLGILVLGGVVVFFMMKGDDNKTNQGVGPGTGSTGTVAVDAPQVAIADAAEVTPPPVIDAAATGPTTSDQQKIIDECKTANNDRNWIKLSDCGRRLQGADGQAFVELANSESRAEAALRNMKQKLAKNAKPGDFKEAADLFGTIGEKSVYYNEAKTLYDGVRNDLVQSTIADLNALSKDCVKYNAKAKGVENLYGKAIVDEAKKTAKACTRVDTEPVNPPKKPCDGACKNDERCDKETNKCEKKVATVVKPPNQCGDVQFVTDTEGKGDAAMTSGSFAQALNYFEQILICKPALQTKAYLAACRARSFPKAKVYFRGLKDSYAQICLKEGFDPRTP